MKTWSRILTVLFAGLVLAAQFPGVAQTLPSATYTIHANPSVIQHSPGTVSNAGGTATAGAFPSPFLDLSASSTAGAGASGDIAYYFEYFGQAGTTLPVDVSYSMSFSGDPDLGLESESITLLDNFSQTGIDGFCMGSNNCFVDHAQASHSGVLTDILNANTVYEIHLSGFAGTFGGTGTSHVFIDPVISIDSAFTGDPNSYSLLLSDGVGNSAESTSATPEPAAMGLMAAGLIMMGMFRCRRV